MAKLHVAAEAAGLNSGDVVLAFKSEATYVEAYVTGLRAAGRTPRAAGEGRWTASAPSGRLSFEYEISKTVPWHSNIPWSTGKEISIYADSECALFMAPYLFIFPAREEFSSIRVKFVVPAGWEIVTPYTFDGEYYVAKKTTTSLLNDFLDRQQIYMGPMRYYAERTAEGCLIRFGQLRADENIQTLQSQDDVEAYADATARTVLALTEVFGENPYEVFAMYANFRRNDWRFPGTRYFGNGYQYWPEGRWDELTGHTIFAWAGKGGNPLVMKEELAQGLLEDYYGQLLAWELFADCAYRAKMYWYFLMYSWMYDHRDRPLASYSGSTDEYEAYLRWEFISLLLDQQIRQSTGGKKTLTDALKWLYQKYGGSGHVVDESDLEGAISAATGVDLTAVFSTYVYGDAELPVYSYLASYRQDFIDYVPRFEQLRHHDYAQGHVVALLIDTVLAAALGEHLVFTLREGLAEGFAQEILQRFTVDELSEADVTAVLSEMTGEDCSDFFRAWSETYGPLDIEQARAWLEDYAHKGGRQTGSLGAHTESPGSKGATLRIEEPRQDLPFDQLGRGVCWGLTDAGTINWTTPLVESIPICLSISIEDQSVLERIGSRTVATFGVEFDGPSGWGSAILGVDASRKTVFTQEYQDGGSSMKYFEHVQVPVVAEGEGWETEICVLPFSSIARFTIGHGETAFGIDVAVGPAVEDVTTREASEDGGFGDSFDAESVYLDGVVGDEWERALARISDPAGDANRGDVDLQDVYIAVDEHYLYIRLDTSEIPSSEVEYTVDLKASGSSTRYSICTHSHCICGPSGWIQDLEYVIGDVIEIAVPRLAYGDLQMVYFSVDARLSSSGWSSSYDHVRGELMKLW